MDENGNDQSGGEPFDKIIEGPEGAKRESPGRKTVASTTEDIQHWKCSRGKQKTVLEFRLVYVFCRQES